MSNVIEQLFIEELVWKFCDNIQLVKMLPTCSRWNRLWGHMIAFIYAQRGHLTFLIAVPRHWLELSNPRGESAASFAADERTRRWFAYCSARARQEFQARWIELADKREFAVMSVVMQYASVEENRELRGRRDRFGVRFWHSGTLEETARRMTRLDRLRMRRLLRLRRLHAVAGEAHGLVWSVPFPGDI
jgi:hypothetical protein